MPDSEIYDLSVDWESRDEGSEDLLESIPTELIDEDEVLYQQGDAPVEFSVIRLGKMEVAKQAPDGSRSVLKILGPGEPVGAMAVINDFDYPATVKALQDTIVYRFSADLLPAIQEEAPQWWGEKLSKAAGRISDLADRLESINTQDVKQRISKQLCKLAEKHGDRENGNVIIDTKITRQMIADMVGCRVESAIRTMSVWEKKGIIRTDESRITLQQPEKLYSIAGETAPEDF